MQARFNGSVEEAVMEAQVEMEVIPTDAPALRHATILSMVPWRH